MKNPFLLLRYTTQFEKIIFFTFLMVCVANVWLVDIYITLDGPAHLYNAGLHNLIEQSPFLQEYYTRSRILVPNYLSSFVLSKFLLMFDPMVAEKLLLSGIVILLPLSFRQAVKSITGRSENPYSYLIFLLVFSKLLHHGFYNFILAFVFLNIQIILLLRYLKEPGNIMVMVLFMVNAFLLYLSHALVFCLTACITLIYTGLKIYPQLKSGIKLLLVQAFMYLPGMILLLVFILNVSISDYDTDLRPFEKTTAFMVFDPGLVYDTQEEIPYTSIVTLVLVFLIGHAITQRGKVNTNGSRIKKRDLFLMLALGFIYLIFHSKDGLFGGMFIHRLLYFSFYFIAFWLSCSLIYSSLPYVLSLMCAALVFLHLSVFRTSFMNKEAHQAQSVIKASQYIQERSVVLSVNYSTNWVQTHYSNYLGINKEVVISDNYEAVLQWFPLKWKEKIFPLLNQTDLNGMKNNLPDYVFVYGIQEGFNKPVNERLRAFLTKNANLLFASSDKFCRLYKVQNKHF